MMNNEIGDDNTKHSACITPELTRRQFVAGTAAGVVMAGLADAGGTLAANAAAPSGAGPVVLEDAHWHVTIDGATGALTSVGCKDTHWVIQRRPELGVSFRMLAPLPQRHDNFILGQQQRVAQIDKISAHQVRVHWNGLASEHAGILPIKFTATISLEVGELRFHATVENHSALAIETIDYPYIGDFSPPTPDSQMWLQHMWYGNLQWDEIYPAFGNEKGYWGVNCPTKTIEGKQCLFCLVQARRRGLYVGMDDPTQPYLLEYTFVQHPGVISGQNSLVPRQPEISGQAVHLDFRTCHFIYAQAHTAVKLAPVVMRGYDGDWHAGVDVYKKWRTTWFKPPHRPDWVKEVHSWTMLRMNTPVNDYSVRYTDFVQYGREYAANGVRAVQLVGWNKGGQDGGDPSLDTDPGLGTWQEFHDAITAVQAMGVKVILFGKLNWADLTTPRYAEQLYKYQCSDPYGIPYQQGGYSYITPPELAGISQHRRAVMDFLDPAYQEIALKEFQKILALGAAGWLWDEVCQHGPVDYNFASGHGYKPPGYIYAGDLPMARRLRAAADKVNPDFLFSGEGPQDWLAQYYAVSEAGVMGVPICQYLDGRLGLLAGVSGFDDRETLNMCLLLRLIIQYEPYYYKGRLSNFPLTLAYGKKIDALRRRYREFLWDGEFRDQLGVDVTARGPHRFSVFHAADGRRAVVVVNPDFDRAITATVKFPQSRRLTVATPEYPDTQSTNGVVRIAQRSAALVMEI